MTSLIPPHLQTSTKISLSRLDIASNLLFTINYLQSRPWPVPTRPFISMMITFLEREYLVSLELGASELTNLIHHLKEAKVDLSTPQQDRSTPD